MNYNKTKEQINKIIDISTSIFNIYKKFIEIETNNDYSEYNNYTIYLKIATEVEDNAYKELMTMCNTDDFYKIYNFLIEHKTINNLTSIKERIENHIAYISYGNTEEEKTNDTDEGLEENSNKTIFAAATDFSQKLVKELNNEIITTTDSKYKEYLIKMKYGIIYSKKNIEYNLLSNKFRRISEKESLLKNGQDKKLVEETYLLYITDNINYNIASLIIKKDQDNNGTDEIDDKISLLFLKTYLQSLTIYEQFDILVSLKNFVDTNKKYKLDNKNLNKIIKIFMETMNISDKSKIKTKTKKK